MLYNSLGLELSSLIVGQGQEQVISLEWMKGLSPQALSSEASRQDATTRSSRRARFVASRAAKVGTSTPAHQRVPSTSRDTRPRLPSALKKPNSDSSRKIQSQPAELMMSGALSVSEVQGTVRRTPMNGRLSPKVRFVNDAQGSVDLFTTVKDRPPPVMRSPNPPRGVGHASRLASRPRVSSSTFVRKPSQEEPQKDASLTSGPPVSASNFQDEVLQSRAYRKVVPVRVQRYRRNFSPMGDQSSSAESILSLYAHQPKTITPAVTNSEIPSKSSGRSTLFAPYMNRTAVSGMPRNAITHPASDAKPPLPMRNPARVSGEKPAVASDRRTATPAVDGVDSAVDSPDMQKLIQSYQSMDLPVRSKTWASPETNVWAAASSADEEYMSPAQRRAKVRERLEATKSRSAVDAEIVIDAVEHSESSYSTAVSPHSMGDELVFSLRNDAVPQSSSTTKLALQSQSSDLDSPDFPPPLIQSPLPQAGRSKTLLSASDEAMYTAESRMGTDTIFSPKSEDIRAMCPRSSSLKRCEKKTSNRRKLGKQDPARHQSYEPSPYALLNRASLHSPAHEGVPPSKIEQTASMWNPPQESRTSRSEALQVSRPDGRLSWFPEAAPSIERTDSRQSMPKTTRRNKEKRTRKVKNEETEQELNDEAKRHFDARVAAFALLGIQDNMNVSAADHMHEYFSFHNTDPPHDQRKRRSEGGGSRNRHSFTGSDDNEEVLVAYGQGTSDRKRVYNLQSHFSSSSSSDSPEPRITKQDSHHQNPDTHGNDTVSANDLDNETPPTARRISRQPRYQRNELTMRRHRPRRCQNCRVLLKTKRELQDDVTNLNVEVVELRREVFGLRTLVERLNGEGWV